MCARAAAAADVNVCVWYPVTFKGDGGRWPRAVPGPYCLKPGTADGGRRCQEHAGQGHAGTEWTGDERLEQLDVERDEKRRRAGVSGR